VELFNGWFLSHGQVTPLLSGTPPPRTEPLRPFLLSSPFCSITLILLTVRIWVGAPSFISHSLPHRFPPLSQLSLRSIVESMKNITFFTFSHEVFFLVFHSSCRRSVSQAMPSPPSSDKPLVLATSLFSRRDSTSSSPCLLGDAGRFPTPLHSSR